MDVDKSLEEIISGKGADEGGGRGGRPRGGGGGNRRNWRRDRVEKSPTRGSERPRSRSPGRSNHRRGRGGGGSDRERGSNRGHTIMISNLFYNLNESDLEDLFGKVGPIKKVKIQYDKSGRSEGYAWVTFDYHDDAREAIERYDGKRAAGQTIGITMARGFGFQRFEGNEFSRRLDSRDGRRGGGRGGGVGRGGGSRGDGAPNRRPKKTAEELDAELDAYMGGEKPEEGTQEQEKPESQGDVQPEDVDM